MSYKWTQKAVIDEMLQELWSAANETTFLAKTIGWINEIQDNLTQEIRIPYYEINLKKLLPTQQDVINLSPQVPDAPSAAINSGGSLVDGTSYKVYVTFVIWDDDVKRYIESEPSLASGVVTGTSTNKTIDVTSIDTYNGDTSYRPTTIYRNIYVAKTDSNGDYGDPFFSSQITDNTTTTATITSEPTSTVSPPSDSEIDMISEKQMTWAAGTNYLRKQSRSILTRYSPDVNQDSTTPYYFDFVGHDSIYLYPRLDSSSTDAQRTLLYQVYRRPHEVFYDATRQMDMPIAFKRALKCGVKWLGYDHRDRDGYRSRQTQYEEEKAKLIRKYGINRGHPQGVVDVNGDTDGYSIN